MWSEAQLTIREREREILVMLMVMRERKLQSSACMRQRQASLILKEIAVRIAKEKRNNLVKDLSNLYPGGWATSVVDI